MRGVQAKRILLLATALASLGWAQVPVINNLQASQVNGNPTSVALIKPVSSLAS